MTSYAYGQSPAGKARRRLEERNAMMEAAADRARKVEAMRKARRKARALEANLRPVEDVLAEAETIRRRAIGTMTGDFYEAGRQRLADATHEWMQHTYAASPKVGQRRKQGKFAA